MAAPTVTTRIDWANKGAFTGAYDTVAPLSPPDGQGIRLSRGASADLGIEAVGEMSFDLDNVGHRYTPDRNWCDNPSFEIDTSGWSVAPLDWATTTGVSISQVTDNAPGAGTKAAEVVTTAALASGVRYVLPYRFLAGVAYTFSVVVKWVSGNTNLQLYFGNSADAAAAGFTGTSSWVRYAVTWTPSADREAVVLFVLTSTAAASTFRIDAVQLNPGSAANAYVEAPTKGQLVPGRPVHCYATNAGVDTAKFYGFIHRITPDPANERVSITCRDVLQRMAETDVVVPANTYVERSARDMRLAVLEDFERGTRNLVSNPSFEVNTTGWATSGGTISRVAGDSAPGGGSACGEYVATTSGQRLLHVLRLAPVFFGGQTYRSSVWLRTTSGTATVVVGLTQTSFAADARKTVVVTTTWQRFTVTFTLTEGATASAGFTPTAFIESTGAVTVRLDNAAVTRGEALHSYADTGSGRWPNWVVNGGFEGGIVNGFLGWNDLWTNLVGNPSFEVNATGWVGVTRLTTAPAIGVGHGNVTGAVSGTYNLTGTFKAGVQYRLSVRARAASGSAAVTAALLSIGTPADTASAVSSVNTNYSEISVAWTPSADRTDAQIKLDSASTFYVDAVQVVRYGSAVPYSDTGPGGGGKFTSSLTIVAGNTAKYGYRFGQVATTAEAGPGRVYDFSHIGAYFVAGVQYVASIWLRPSSTMAYKVGIGANKGDGTWDEATTTGSATAGVWTQVTLTWTPSADRAATAGATVVFWWQQTDAVARTVDHDAARVTPGSVADAYEMAHWSVPPWTGEATDLYANTASLSGSALAALSTLNGLTLTRHWIRPTMTAPFYTYIAEDRDTFAAKAVAATFTEDIQGWDDLDLDRDAIVNVVGISWATGSDVYSDEASVAGFGPQPGGDIDGAGFFPDRTIPDVIGPALVRRYSFPRQRPRLRAEQQFANQLALDLNDVVAVNLERFLVRSRPFVILREDLTITEGGRSWVTEFALEEFPY